ncbi:Uncharacterized protein C9orf50 [Lemmus lemmus]
MFWRQPAAGTPAYEPKRCPDGAAPRRSTPLLPRLPYLSPGVPYGPRGRGTLRALLLPPLLPFSMARGAGTRGTRQPVARDDPGAVSALLGEFLPNKFRDFLHQLRAKCAEPEAHTPSTPQYPKGASAHCLGLRGPSCSFLPDLWDQSLHSEDSFREKPTLGPPRGEFITARKANPPSGEGSRPRRRYCPFRVRFADETPLDATLRYCERNRAGEQRVTSIQQMTLPAVSASERGIGSVGRCLDSRPRALRPRAQDTVAGSSYWNYPRVSAQEPQLCLPEDSTMSSHLPFISRANTPRPRGGLRTFLNTPNTVEQESFLPSLVRQYILKGGRPKGYRLILPSTNRQQAQR